MTTLMNAHVVKREGSNPPDFELMLKVVNALEAKNIEPFIVVNDQGNIEILVKRGCKNDADIILYEL